jgi:hypothetical protein
MALVTCLLYLSTPFHRYTLCSQYVSRRPSETSAHLRTTWCYIPEDGSILNYRSEHLNSYHNSGHNGFLHSLQATVDTVPRIGQELFFQIPSYPFIFRNVSRSELLFEHYSSLFPVCPVPLAVSSLMFLSAPHCFPCPYSRASSVLLSVNEFLPVFHRYG